VPGRGHLSSRIAGPQQAEELGAPLVVQALVGLGQQPPAPVERVVLAAAMSYSGWPRRPDGRRAWTFHSLRHVFATWALSRPGARIEDVSRLLGHSTVRVTQDLYISADGDLFERFFTATE